MFSFHPIGLADKPWIDRLVFAGASRSADFCFGSMYLWDERYRQLVCESGGRLVVLAHAHGAPIYPWPVGDGELAPVIDEMLAYARRAHFPFVMRGIEQSGCEALEAMYPGKFTFQDDRVYSDYLYESEALATLSGKKLHAKRNFINRFEQTHDWHFEKLQPEHFERCLILLEKWRQEEPASMMCTVNGEHDAIMLALKHYSELGLLGGALFAEGEMIAFTIGERICADTVDVHFEKADASIDGAYPMINREFVRLIRETWPEVTWINREDDMGLDNLRQSKLSYHPAYILEKYTARLKQ